VVGDLPVGCLSIAPPAEQDLPMGESGTARTVKKLFVAVATAVVCAGATTILVAATDSASHFAWVPGSEQGGPIWSPPVEDGTCGGQMIHECHPT
jgi:hypothetical protein